VAINDYSRILRTILFGIVVCLCIIQSAFALSIVGWGSNTHNAASPPGGNDFAAIDACGHSLALKEDGTIIGWGINLYGMATPPEGNDYVAIAAGGQHSLALKADGSIIGWGDNRNGQATPPEGNEFVVIAAGGAHSLALKADGSIVGWGFNNYGQATPPEGNDYISISAGDYHSLALKADGSIVGWGNNWFGQAMPPEGNEFLAISAGGYQSLALKADGSIIGWGYNWKGRATPPEGNEFVAIAAGGQHSLALKADGSIVAWGNDNTYGQATSPGGNHFIAISAGDYHSLALKEVHTEYSGGSGIAEDPYQIATAEKLILLGETPADYDKHFILTADIDMDPNLPGRKVFDKAVIAPDSDKRTSGYQRPLFAGFFDGNGYSISNLRIIGHDYLGLFGRIGSEAKVSNVNLKDMYIEGISDVGSITGHNDGSITACCSEGIIIGRDVLGGLVGINRGHITMSHSISKVSGNDEYIGGLLGLNDEGGIVEASYSKGTVMGHKTVGGLVGYNNGSISTSFSWSTVIGENYRIGGLVGTNGNNISTSYSTGGVRGDDDVGGLVGWNYGNLTKSYSIGALRGIDNVGGLVGNNFRGSVNQSFWDIGTSKQQTSDGGIGRETAAMHTISTFLAQGWDFVGEVENGTENIWQIPDGGGYPILSIIPIEEQVLPSPVPSPVEIYEIATADDLISLGQRPEDYDKHFILTADIDLDPCLPGRKVFEEAVIAPDINQMNGKFDGISFIGIFDGNGHVIRNLHIDGQSYLGLFGEIGIGAIVSNLGVEAVDINGGSGGGLADINSGRILSCYTTGVVSGTGGLVSYNRGQIMMSHSTATVICGGAWGRAGGLVGHNVGSISYCYSGGSVNGVDGVVSDLGGLVGINSCPSGTISNCYSTSNVNGTYGFTGGLVGQTIGALQPDCFPTITASYSVGKVDCYWNWPPSGFVGEAVLAPIYICFWDKMTSNQETGVGSIDGIFTVQLFGRTTSEMQTASTFLEAGWDFIDETENGTDDIWWILEGQDYPRLWWEMIPEN